MEIQQLKLNEIKEYKNNAKQHPQWQIDQIINSIKEFGFNDPIAIDENNVIIEGHGRYEAAKQIGFEYVDTIKLEHLDEEQKKAYILVHNKLTMNTDFDIDLLDGELEDIISIDMENFGFDLFEEEEELELNKKQLDFESAGNYTSAPLPFQGQKRNSIKKFIELIKEHYTEDNIFVDLFGGSGLLSVNIKKAFPNAEVYYNDFDDYVLRCKKVDQTNEIIEKISWATNNIDGKQRLTVAQEEYIKELLSEYNDIDAITISGNLLFSGNYAKSFEELYEETFYNRVRKKKFNSEYVKNFHNNLNITKLDWEENFNKWKDNDKVVFIVDPPYMRTDISSYSNNDNWKPSEFLKINALLKEYNHVFFTSDKSNIIDFHYFMVNYFGVGIFNKEIIHSNTVGVNKTSEYKDYMVFSFAERD